MKRDTLIVLGFIALCVLAFYGFTKWLGSLGADIDRASQTLITTAEPGDRVPLPAPDRPHKPETALPGKPLHAPTTAPVDPQHPLGALDPLLTEPIGNPERLLDNEVPITNTDRLNRHNLRECEFIKGMFSIPHRRPRFTVQEIDVPAPADNAAMALLVSQEYGPFVQDTRYMRCFSMTPMGSVYAAIFLLTVDNQPHHKGLLTNSMRLTNAYTARIGMGADSSVPLIYAPDITASPGTPLIGQVRGFKVDTFAQDGSTSRVHVYFGANGDKRVVEMIVSLRYEDRDWRLDTKPERIVHDKDYNLGYLPLLTN